MRNKQIDLAHAKLVFPRNQQERRSHYYHPGPLSDNRRLRHVLDVFVRQTDAGLNLVKVPTPRLPAQDVGLGDVPIDKESSLEDCSHTGVRHKLGCLRRCTLSTEGWHKDAGAK